MINKLMGETYLDRSKVVGNKSLMEEVIFISQVIGFNKSGRVFKNKMFDYIDSNIESFEVIALERLYNNKLRAGFIMPYGEKRFLTLSRKEQIEKSLIFNMSKDPTFNSMKDFNYLVDPDLSFIVSEINRFKLRSL